MAHEPRCLLLIVVAVVYAFVGIGKSRAQPIDVYDPNSWERPILIAHRGGVITSKAAENSAAAVQLAAENGFAMVEVDVRETKDHVPVAFHDSNLSDAVGINARIEDLELAEITVLRHTQTGQEILTLDQMFGLCARLELGVMLDIKTDGSEAFFQEIAELLRNHDLGRSAITFSDHPHAMQHLEGHVMFAVTSDEVAQVRSGEAVDLTGTFWFGLPRDIDEKMINALQRRGALVIPAINTFRYPADRHMELAEEDVKRLTAAGVDGFQIDSIYAPLFKSP